MSQPRWTEKDDERLRAMFGREPAAAIASKLGRTADSIYARARLLGLRSELHLRGSDCRLWDDETDAVIRALYHRETADAIAARIGRTKTQVYRRAVKLGVSRSIFALSPEEDEQIRRLNADGWSDAHVAGHLRRDRHAVSLRRRRLGLPSQAKGPRTIELVRKRTREQLDKAGLRTLEQLRIETWAKRAAERGWPTTINGRNVNPRHVAILDLLYERGPQTRRAIAEVIGMRTDFHQSKVLHSMGPGGSYLAELMRAGLVVDLGRIVQVGGKGRNVHLYALSLDVERNVPDGQRNQA